MNNGQKEQFDDFVIEEIDFKKYITAIKSGWKKILTWAVASAVIGFFIALSIPKNYTSIAKVAPEITTRSSSNGLTSLASLAGINMSSMAVTDAMHPDLYPQIVASSDFLIGLFDMPVEYKHKGTMVSTDLYEYVANHTKQPWWGYVLGFPHLVGSWGRALFSKKTEEDIEGYAVMDSIKFTPQQEMVIKSLGQSIKVAFDKKTYVITIKVTMQDRIIAARLANRIVDHLQDFVTAYRTLRARENVEYYQKLYDENREKYLEAQNKYAWYVDSHQGSLLKSSQVEQQHLQAEANLQYQVYTQSAQNLINAQAKVQLESPVLVVVQSAIAPLHGKPSKVKFMMLFFVLGALAATAVCVYRQ